MKQLQLVPCPTPSNGRVRAMVFFAHWLMFPNNSAWEQKDDFD